MHFNIKNNCSKLPLVFYLKSTNNMQMEFMVFYKIHVVEIAEQSSLTIGLPINDLYL